MEPESPGNVLHPSTASAGGLRNNTSSSVCTFHSSTLKIHLYILVLHSQAINYFSTVVLHGCSLILFTQYLGKTIVCCIERHYRTVL